MDARHSARTRSGARLHLVPNAAVAERRAAPDAEQRAAAGAEQRDAADAAGRAAPGTRQTALDLRSTSLRPTQPAEVRACGASPFGTSAR